MYTYRRAWKEKWHITDRFSFSLEKGIEKNRWARASCTQPNEINDPGLGKDTLVRETLRASTEVNEELPGKLFLRDLYTDLRTYNIPTLQAGAIFETILSFSHPCHRTVALISLITDTSFKRVLSTIKPKKKKIG